MQQSAQVPTLELENGVMKQEVAELKVEKAGLIADADFLQAAKVRAEQLMHAAHEAQVEAQRDVQWLMTVGMQGVFKRIWEEPQMVRSVASLLEKSKQYRAKVGFKQGFEFCLSSNSFEENPFRDVNAEEEYDAEVQVYDRLTFPFMEIIEQCAQLRDGARHLRAAFEEAERANREEAERLEKEEAGRVSVQQQEAGASGSRPGEDGEEEEEVDYEGYD